MNKLEKSDIVDSTSDSVDSSRQYFSLDKHPMCQLKDGITHFTTSYILCKHNTRRSYLSIELCFQNVFTISSRQFSIRQYMGPDLNNVYDTVTINLTEEELYFILKHHKSGITIFSNLILEQFPGSLSIRRVSKNHQSDGVGRIYLSLTEMELLKRTMESFINDSTIFKGVHEGVITKHIDREVVRRLIIAYVMGCLEMRCVFDADVDDVINVLKSVRSETILKHLTDFGFEVDKSIDIDSIIGTLVDEPLLLSICISVVALPPMTRWFAHKFFCTRCSGSD